MSSAPSTRVSACRDSQALFLASTEPMLRNSVMISVAGEENDSGVHDTLSKNDSLLSSSQQNDSAYPEDSSEDSTDRSIYSPVKLRHPKVHVMSICLQFCLHLIRCLFTFFQHDQRPLTRYLPITSQDLNLKSHIESSGHQIESCTQIQLSSANCKGYLHKWTNGKLRKAWNKKYFVFDRKKKLLSYFTNQNQKEGTHIPFQVGLMNWYWIVIFFKDWSHSNFIAGYWACLRWSFDKKFFQEMGILCENNHQILHSMCSISRNNEDLGWCHIYWSWWTSRCLWTSYGMSIFQNNAIDFIWIFNKTVSISYSWLTLRIFKCFNNLAKDLDFLD